jgi:hypothetical protein
MVIAGGRMVIATSEFERHQHAQLHLPQVLSINANREHRRRRHCAGGVRLDLESWESGDGRRRAVTRLE